MRQRKRARAASDKKQPEPTLEVPIPDEPARLLAGKLTPRVDAPSPQGLVSFLVVASWVGVYGSLLIPLVWIPAIYFPFVYGKMVFMQVLVGLTFPAWLVLAYLVPAYRPRWTLLHSAVAFQLAAILLSTAFAFDRTRAFWGNPERMGGWFSFLHIVMWFFMLTGMIRTRANVQNLLRAVVVIATSVSVSALVQYRWPDYLGKVIDPATFRISGLLGNPIFLGGYISLAVLLAGWLALRDASGAWRFFHKISLVLLTATLFGCGSRGPLLSLALAIASLGIGYVVWGGVAQQTKKLVVGVCGGAVGAYLLGAIAMALQSAPSRATLLTHYPFLRPLAIAISFEDRWVPWKIALSGFVEHPILGWGHDNYYAVFNKHFGPYGAAFGYAGSWVDRPHNYVLEVLSGDGLIGLAAQLGVWAAVLVLLIRAVRRDRDSLLFVLFVGASSLAAILNGLLVFETPVSSMMFALMMALTAISFSGNLDTTADRPENIEPSTHRLAWRLGLAASVLLVLLLCLAGSLRPALGSYYSVRANRMGRTAQWDAMLFEARKAYGIWTPYLDDQAFGQANLVVRQVDAGKLQNWPRWREIVDHARLVNTRYFELRPHNVQQRMAYGVMLTVVGRLLKDPNLMTEAELQYFNAEKDSPRRRELLVRYGSLYAETGRVDQAVEKLEAAIALDPEDGEVLWHAGAVYWRHLRQRQRGAELMSRSRTARIPHGFEAGEKNLNQVLLAAEAFSFLKDRSSLASLVKELEVLTGAEEVYVELARVMERNGLLDERDFVLRRGVGRHGSLRPLAKLVVSRKVKTIAEGEKLRTEAASLGGSSSSSLASP